MIAAQTFSHPIDGLRDVEKWECLDSATGEASAFIGFRRDKLAEAVRKNHLPDFL